MRPELECVALAGKAGGLRTAALVLREADKRGGWVSLLSLAKAIENAADDVEKEALSHMPFGASEKQ